MTVLVWLSAWFFGTVVVTAVISWAFDFLHRGRNGRGK